MLQASMNEPGKQFWRYISLIHRGCTKGTTFQGNQRWEEYNYSAGPEERKNPWEHGSGISRFGGGIKNPHLLPAFPQRTDPDRGAWLSFDVFDIQQLVLFPKSQEMRKE